MDQMRRKVLLNLPPRRIVSLVPSITEYLIDIGASVVGRTKFCIHPKPAIDAVPVVGGTKRFQMETIRGLTPDLIVGNKEENYQEGILELEQHYPVWMSDVYDLKDAREMMLQLGRVVQKEVSANAIIRQHDMMFSRMANSEAGRVIYLIWKNPWIAVGRKTYIHSFLSHLGYENVIEADRYPEVTLADIQNLQPDKILLSTEPFPFKDADVKECVNAGMNAELVDGERYSWYGSRVIWLDS